MQFLLIVGLSIASAVVYGIAHDQITARVCVEYFTIGHAPVFDTEDPTLLGLGWGVIATWWMGALLGTPLAVTARLGPWPKRSARSLVRPIAILLAVMAVSAFAAGVIGWQLASSGAIELHGDLAELVPPEKHVAFLADGAAHLASYGVGFFGGVFTIAWIGVSRIAAGRKPTTPHPA